ncbi:sensor histidine kinase [Pedobacter namyangjuensis]|uniref:sensor histidine kinase n=1 Tax=Pedobacter namyangjuensis TaxID=600626 RepID=UPI000DE2CA4E|nr:PAS domain S-box protein [Pedobacter namyangjuensis]
MERRDNKFSAWFVDRPRLTGFLFFLVLIGLNFFIINQRYQLFKENKNKEISNILNASAQNIEQSLKNSYTVALTLALTLDNNGVPKNFDKVADQLIRSNPGIQAVQLVPNGVVKYMYPVKGNEAAINLNLYKSHPQTVFEVQKAINGRKMYFQGPVKLTQGGVGLIGRLPLYIDNKFWGFSAVVIKLETFFKNAGIDNTKHTDYQFQFSKINEFTQKEEFFLPLNPNFENHLSKSVLFPEGDWRLYVINVNRYDTWYELISAILLGLGLSVLSTYLLVRLIKKQSQLQGLVQHQATKLIDTENKFEKIFDHAAIGIARINSKTGYILEVNDYLCNFLGYTQEELMQTKIKSVIYPDDLEEDRLLFKRLLAGEIRQFNKELRYVKKDGSVIWSNVTITPLWKDGEAPTNHIVIIEDVTQRKLKEQILRASQQRLESLINTIDGIVWEGEFDSYECTYISKKVEDILGYTVEEWMGTPGSWNKYLYEKDRPRLQKYLELKLITGAQHDEEYRMVAKDGSIVWIRDIVTLIETAGEGPKLRGIMIDITSKKHAEMALNKSFHLVTEQNKRLLNFSYIVSHNLRSHASNIQSITTLIESAKDEGERIEMIQLLKKVANNLNETLFNLNNIVSIQTSVDIEVEPLSLREYINRSVAIQKTQILAKQAVILNRVDEEFIVNYNRAYLESILLNLISNALKYSSPDRKPVISLDCVEEKGEMVLKISDNGIGIDLTKHGEKIFGIYQTFNGNSDAHGFGLFISKNQVEAMGGKIEVESELNQGTTFKIFFKKKPR